MTTKQIIKIYEPVINGVVTLFSPFMECAVHDIKTGTITAIYSNITNRKIGDPSPLAQLHMPVEKFPDVFDPYYEINWDGRKIKCTSITIRDEKKKPIALICFNFDTSVFQDMNINLAAFLTVKKTADNPVELFGNNWQEKIDGFINDYLTRNNLILIQLTRSQKKTLLGKLSKNGVFFYKNAAPYVAKKLHISRATIYNYLKILRANP